MKKMASQVLPVFARKEESRTWERAIAALLVICMPFCGFFKPQGLGKNAQKKVSLPLFAPTSRMEEPRPFSRMKTILLVLLALTALAG